MQLEKISDSGDKAVLKTVNGTSNDKDKARTESICLEGDKEYQFAIYDSFGDGILSPGRYNITSNDILIVHGREFGNGEITSFSIPFIPGSAISSVITQAPTISPAPWHLTPFPTDPESTGSSPRPQNITLEPTISPLPQTSPSACEDITIKKNCTKSTNNCIWDNTVEGGPKCLPSEA